MSSEEEAIARLGGKSQKKRRIGRACDMCRQKKVRCDGEDGKRCTNCTTFDDKCTYVHNAPKRRTRPRGYVERLENRAGQLEELLNRLCPGFDLLEDFGAAVEESSKINAEQESDEDEVGAGLQRSLSGPDFSHAIPPSLGSPPIASTSSQSSLSAVLNASNPHRHLQSRSPSLDLPASGDDLMPSDDELTTHATLSQRLAQIWGTPRASDAEQDVDSPASTSSHDFDGLGPSTPSAAHARSMSSPEPLMRRRSMPPMPKISRDAAGLDKRFFGKSSNFAILKKAVDMKNEYWRSAGVFEGTPPETEYESSKSTPEAMQEDPRSPPQARPAHPKDGPCQTLPNDSIYPDLLPCGCPDYGAFHPWALPPVPMTYVFPHSALLRTLVNTYFEIQNTYVPALHRPTLERGIREGRHRRDDDFGAVVLLVCALGSRWATDRTVLLGVGDDEGRVTPQDQPLPAGAGGEYGAEGGPDDFWREGEDDEEWHSAGWKWFKQVRFGRKALYGPPSLLDLQAACLITMYLRGSSSPEASRWITGVGLRLAMDMGAHRKKSYSALPTVEGEQLKRAFWSLVFLDWSISPSLGRPCAIQHEDFDLDLPIECDDEFWEPSHPSGTRFAQPAGKPAVVTAFNCLLRLTQIQAYALRTIYSTSKSRTILGFVGPQWEERIVAELDSALNNWLNSLPAHLKWDPRNPNTTYLTQSAVLHAAFYSLQITIHRPFIASRRGVSAATFPLTSLSARFPSLSICTNAARSCVHVSDVLCRRLGQGSHASLGVLHHNMIPLFTSGIVLMLNMCPGSDARRKSSERSTVKEMKEMADVHKAMDMLKVMEVRWHTAGRLWDMLYELAVVNDLPLPSSSHAAVIRSIKQHRGFARGRSSEADATPLPAPLRRRASITVAALPQRSMSQSSFERRLQPASGLSLDMYRSDPNSPWLDYDLSPSVFSQPQSVSSQSADPPQPEVDPALDSVFTMRSQTRKKGTEDMAAVFARTPERANWGVVSHPAKGKERAKTLEHPPTFTTNADFGPNPPIQSGAGAPEEAIPLPAVSDAGSALASGMERMAFSPVQKVYQPTDTIAQVLDTIQSRQAEWPAPQQDAVSAPVHGWPVPGGTMSDTYPPASVFPTDFSVASEDMVGAQQETLAMWQSIPTGFGWDDWGSYINAMGTGYPAANPVRAVMEDAAGHASNSSGQTFGTHGARRMPP